MSTSGKPPRELPAAICRELAAVVGDDGLMTDAGDCWPYGYDNSRRHALPQAVVFATNHRQVHF